jgi:hypothetical protein
MTLTHFTLWIGEAALILYTRYLYRGAHRSSSSDSNSVHGRRVLTILCLACLAAAVVAGCGSGSKSPAPRETVRNTRVGVVVEGRDLPPKISIRRAGRVRSALPRLPRISNTFEIRPSGPLSAPVVIRFPLTQVVPRGDVVIVATAESRNGPWRTLRGQLLVGRKRVLVHVQHFSFFSAFLLDVKSAFSTIKTTILDGLTSNFTAQAKPPTCGDESGAKKDGYEIASDSKDTVFWCFGLENGQRVLRVVNNRRYPLSVVHPGLAVLDAGSVHFDLASLSRVISGKESIIFPRDTVVFSADLKEGTRAGVQTQLDGVGQSLYQLEEGLTAAADVLGRLGTSGNAVKLLKDALASSGCLSALGTSPGEIIAKCVVPLLKTAYGVKGAVAATVVEAGSLAAFFRSEANALFDQLNHRDGYRLVVSRSSAASSTPRATISWPVTRVIDVIGNSGDTAKVRLSVGPPERPNAIHPLPSGRARLVDCRVRGAADAVVPMSLVVTNGNSPFVDVKLVPQDTPLLNQLEGDQDFPDRWGKSSRTLPGASATTACLAPNTRPDGAIDDVAWREVSNETLRSEFFLVVHNFYGTPRAESALAALASSGMKIVVDLDDDPMQVSGAQAAPTPPSQTPASGFSAGAAFDDYCVVAWPTAPIRSSSGIQMTMTCTHVPESQYLFTVVAYGDPNLPITPSTGQMHVTGRVVDVATSGYGYRELVVRADHVDLASR